MIGLAAVASLRVAPDDLGATMRQVLGQPLRREGTLAKLCISGIVACAGQGERMPSAGRTALIWGSASGARLEIDRVIDELCLNDGLPMPFDFIGGQCSSAAVFAARYVSGLECAVYLASGGRIWQQMLCLATCWLNEGRYDQVLCGRVEQAQTDGAVQYHASDWLLLASPARIGPPLARVGRRQAAAPEVCDMADAEIVPALQRWLDSKPPETAAAPAVSSFEFRRI